MDFRFRTVKIGDKSVKLQIWDTAGQERFRTITSSYYRGANGILIVYDTTEAATFENVRRWMNEIERFAADGVVKTVVANKADLAGSEGAPNTVDPKRGAELARQLGAGFQECSAKTGENVDAAFLDMAGIILKQLPEAIRAQDRHGNVVIGEAEGEGEGGCC